MNIAEGVRRGSRARATADMTMNLVVNSSVAREAGKRTRGNWWPDVAAAYFIKRGEPVSVSDKRSIELMVAVPCRRVATN